MKCTRQIIILPYEDGIKANLYTIQFKDEVESETDKFFGKYINRKDLTNDFDSLSIVIDRILEKGALERAFRPEGKMNDRVWALPVEPIRLRLYCIRISDEILIMGNGGAKNDAKYQDDPKLNAYMRILQKLDYKIKKSEKSEETTYYNKNIFGTTTFNI